MRQTSREQPETSFSSTRLLSSFAAFPRSTHSLQPERPAIPEPDHFPPNIRDIEEIMAGRNIAARCESVLEFIGRHLAR
jgi:hypothetical protein